MLEIEFSAEDVARTRFSISPLWEVVAGVRILLGADEQRLHRTWTAQVRSRIAAARLDLTPLAVLMPPGTSSVPGFLTPPPTTPGPSLDVELATLRATPPQRLRAGPSQAQPGVRALRADPERGLGRLADLISAYWELAMAPYWPRILGLLEADIQYRARRFAEGGTRRLFDDLDPQLSWDSGTLHVRHRFLRGVRRLDGRGLLLGPSAFVWPRVFWTTDLVDQPTLRYPPRGVGELWSPRPDPESAALAKVLGASRARLLTELTSPTSTTDLAQRTGLTPGGVSQHLSALRGSGLVSAHRAGRVVLYARTRIAEDLVAGAEGRASRGGA
ncbi:ArsR/SmtB family transcription factor [Streptomyces mesophilus]|uniref:ArsR/SmtB family transcription factor n=1 Tax=Streptomyces mesophilus TaxID=1775132 RepID=UPI00332FA624